MDLLLLALGWLLGKHGLGPRAPERQPAEQPKPAPGAPKKPAAAPAKGKVTTLPEVVIKAKPPAVVPASFPQAKPKDLPPFPDAWEPFIPLPAAVHKRASELIKPLWQKGKNTTKAEKTGDDWVTYQAFVPKKGKKGVAAWRLKPNA